MFVYEFGYPKPEASNPKLDSISKLKPEPDWNPKSFCQAYPKPENLLPDQALVSGYQSEIRMMKSAVKLLNVKYLKTETEDNLLANLPILQMTNEMKKSVFTHLLSKYKQKPCNLQSKNRVGSLFDVKPR